jgi:hypothetical protein
MMSFRQALGLVSLRMMFKAVGSGLAAAVATLLLIGITTDVISNPWFERKVPVHPFDWVVLIAISCLTGALVVTYFLGQSSMIATRTGVGSGVIGWFAVSCPLCNKVVLVLLGTSGATSLFEPVQPYLGALAIVLACAALVVRIRMLLRGTCPVPTPSAGAANADG